MWKFASTMWLILTLAGSAMASSVTLNFAGSADWKPFGKSGLSSFSGSVTWDADALPFFSDPLEASYHLESATFLGSPRLLVPDVTRIDISNDLHTPDVDIFKVWLHFATPIHVGDGEPYHGDCLAVGAPPYSCDISLFVGIFVGSTDMFTWTKPLRGSVLADG